jgi:hypothetical protein
MCRVEVAWEERGEARRQPGFMQDRSESGAQVVLQRAIPVGTLVTISTNREKRPAIVRNCGPQGMEHAIGVEYQPAESIPNYQQ